MKTKIYRLTSVGIAFILFLAAGVTTLASIDINSVTRLDLTKGKVSGQKAPYSIQLSKIWSWYLIADREEVDKTSGIKEKIRFYYEPRGSVTKPSLLLTFYVYDRNYWNEKSALRKILTTEEHVFAATSVSYNPFTVSTDKTLFSRLMQEAGDDDFVKAMISLPKGTKVITANTITVSGRTLKPKCFTSESGAVYLPIRDVCSALGYTVGWLEKDKAISIKKADFYHLLLTGQTKYKQSFDIEVVNGISYAPSMFFVQVIKANVEIDENSNVNITE